MITKQSLMFTDIKKSYDEHVVLDFTGQTLTLTTGDILLLKGPSGLGKSTLLNVLTGMAKLDSGCIEYINQYGGKETIIDFTKFLSSKVSYMSAGSILFDHFTIKENLLYTTSDDKKDEAEKILEKLGIKKILFSYPYEISSGEYKRAVLARCILEDKPFIFMDEPTSNLDPLSAEIIAKEISELKDKGVFIATHDNNLQGTKTIRLKGDHSYEEESYSTIDFNYPY